MNFTTINLRLLILVCVSLMFAINGSTQSPRVMNESERRAKILEFEESYNSATTTEDKVRFGFQLASLQARNNYEGARLLADKSLSLAIENGDNLITSRAYLAHGRFCLESSHSTEALQSFQTGISYAKNDKIPTHLLAAFYENVGAIYADMGLIEKSLEYFLLSADALIQSPDSYNKDNSLCRQYIRIASLFSENGLYDKSIVYNRKSIEVATGIEKWNLVSNAWYSIGKAAAILGDNLLSDEAYAKAAEYQELAKKKRKSPR